MFQIYQRPARSHSAHTKLLRQLIFRRHHIGKTAGSDTLYEVLFDTLVFGRAFGHDKTLLAGTLYIRQLVYTVFLPGGGAISLGKPQIIIFTKDIVYTTPFQWQQPFSFPPTKGNGHESKKNAAPVQPSGRRGSLPTDISLLEASQRIGGDIEVQGDMIVYVPEASRTGEQVVSKSARF